ncbi:MAG: trypsin-like serine protease [Anaerolineales bacterium]|jgi:secreted trypsin-like serine protease
MKRKLLVFTIVFLVTLLAVTPVLAITFGELDGEEHPNVGALLVAWPYPDGPIDVVCSGTLVEPNVFLTAAHCVNWMPAAGIPQDEVYVTFDSVYEIGSSTIYPGSYYINPDYGHDSADPHDVAVVVLDEPLNDIATAELPPAGLLDELKAEGALKGQSFVTVGYGTVRDDKTGGFHPLYWEGARRFATGTYNALTKSWLKISMNPATGDGGTCYGDSGGPHFLGDSDMVVSVTVTGDAPCRATDVTYRLDTESARSYLKDFVDLP